SQTHETVHWRSDDPAPPPPDYKPLLVLLGLPVAIKLDARGEVTAPGIQSWQDMLEREHATPALRAAFARDEVFRTMFLRLPDQPVKVGDHWRAGELVHELPNVGDVSAKIELRVAAISKDGAQVLLDAAPDLHVDLAGTVTVKTAQSGLRMWSQFDRTRGDVVASALRACADVELAGTGVASSLEMIATYDPRPLAAQPPTTPPPPTPPLRPAPRDAAVASERPDAPVVASAPPDAAPEPPPDAAPEPPTEPPPSDASDLPALLGRALATRNEGIAACAPQGGRVNIALTLMTGGAVQIRFVTGLAPAQNRCIAAAVRGLGIVRARRGPEFPVTYPLVIVGSGPPPPNRPLPATTPNLLTSLHAIDPAVLACGEQHPGGSTQSLVTIVIAADGSVASASAKAEPAVLRACIEAAVQAATFEPSQSGKTVSFGYKVR
ncbi:MAG: hypothetical protein ABI175_22825, partial [Polyangiales bacterium]